MKYVISFGLLLISAAFLTIPSARAQTFNPPILNPAEQTAIQQTDYRNLPIARPEGSQEIELGRSDIRLTSMRIMNVALGFLGILCVVALMFGLPFGIILLCKKELDTTKTPADERSGKGADSIIPKEIQGGWNWGAAGLGYIWGIYHNVWISLLAFIPLVNYIWWIVMGIKGNEWAWRKYKWASVEHFQEAQNKWKPWGIALFALNVFLVIIGFFQQIVVLASMGR